MQAILIGAGRMAEAVLHDLVQARTFDEITLADADLARAEDLGGRRGGGITRASRLDAADIAAATEMIKGHVVCISAVPYRYNTVLAKAAVAAGAHFTDMGGNNDVVAAELALDDEARKAGVTVVPDMGLAPGLGNILAAALMARLNNAEELRLRVGGLPRNPKPPLSYALVFSPYGLINEYAEPCVVIRDGEVCEVAPLTDVEELDFPPFGKLEAFNTSGGASTLPRTFRGRVRTLDYKTIRYPGHCARIKPVFDLGFARDEEITISGVRIRPRDVLAELLSAAVPEGSDDVVLVKCWATAAGGVKKAAFEIVAYADGPSALTAMMRTTGFPVAVAAQFLAEGKATRPGAVPPEEAFAPDEFLAALRARGIAIKEI